MNCYLHKLFTGMLNPLEEIRPDAEEFRTALQRLIETQKWLKDGLSDDQLVLLEDILKQKNQAVAFEIYEAFRAGVKLAVGKCFFHTILIT